jgi:hypothetical protein
MDKSKNLWQPGHLTRWKNNRLWRIGYRLGNNAYDNELWMVKDGDVPVQLTRTNKNSSGNAAFTPDGKYCKFCC